MPSLDVRGLPGALGECAPRRAGRPAHVWGLSGNMPCAGSQPVSVHVRHRGTTSLASTACDCLADAAERNPAERTCSASHLHA
jgi:hypothetical protein